MCHFCLGQDFRQTRAQDDDEADEGTEGAQGGVERVGEAGNGFSGEDRAQNHAQKDRDVHVLAHHHQNDVEQQGQEAEEGMQPKDHSFHLLFFIRGFRWDRHIIFLHLPEARLLPEGAKIPEEKGAESDGQR